MLPLISKQTTHAEVQLTDQALRPPYQKQMSDTQSWGMKVDMCLQLQTVKGIQFW